MNFRVPRIPIYTLVVIVVVWAMYPLALLWGNDTGFITKNAWEASGVFGDSFGALNTLFSGLALAGLAINILIQNRQLRELEKKEERTANLINVQIKLAALSTMLDSHNSDADKFQRIGQAITGSDPIDNFSRITAVQNHENAIAKRNLVVAEIERILAEARKADESRATSAAAASAA